MEIIILYDIVLPKLFVSCPNLLKSYRGLYVFCFVPRNFNYQTMCVCAVFGLGVFSMARRHALVSLRHALVSLRHAAPSQRHAAFFLFFFFIFLFFFLALTSIIM